MWLIRFGCDPEWMADLDLHSFNALVESAMRITYAERIEEANATRLAFHADAKVYGKQVKIWEKLSGEEKKGDANDFDAALRGLGMMK